MHYKLRRICTNIGALALGLCSMALGQGPGTYGTAFQLVNDTPTANYIWANYIVIGPVPVTSVNCGMYIGTGGTAGGHIDCLVLAATSGTTNGGTAICHSTYTEGASAPNAFVTWAMPCDLSAYGTYWLGQSTDDGGVFTGEWYCGDVSPTCSNTGDPNTGSFGAMYVAVAYGTYTGIPTSQTNHPTSQKSIFITTKPTAVVTVGRGKGTFF